MPFFEGAVELLHQRLFVSIGAEVMCEDEEGDWEWNTAMTYLLRGIGLEGKRDLERIISDELRAIILPHAAPLVPRHSQRCLFSPVE